MGGYARIESDQAPAVTAVMPVRNGAQSLELAVRNLLEQTYPALEVIICDNASSDATAEICKAYVSASSRVRVVRQEIPVTAIQNFQFGYSQVKTPYFFWAAHDDLRSPDYVERLVQALEQQPAAGVAFGELVEFSDYAKLEETPKVGYDCSTVGMSYAERLRSRYKSKCVEIYGLWRTEVLRRYPWFDIEIGPDLPLLTYAVVKSEIIQIPGPVFCQYGPPVAKTHESRARDNSFGSLKPFRLLRLSHKCALAAEAASTEKGRKRSWWISFVILYSTIVGLRIRTIIYEASPPKLQHLYKNVKRRVAPGLHEGQLGSSSQPAETFKP